MGKSINRVFLLGNLGKDPELTYTQGGTAKCRFSIATSERVKDRAGEYQEQTTWHNIVVWGASAEACGKYLAKGRQVAVEGKIENRSYEKDGQTRYISEVIARDVTFIGGGDGASRGGGAPSRGAGGPAGGGAPQGGRGQGGPAGGRAPERRAPADDSWAEPQPPAANDSWAGAPDDDNIPF